MYLSDDHEFNPNNVSKIEQRYSYFPPSTQHQHLLPFLPPPPPPNNLNSDELVDNWIKSRLAGVIQECDRAMQTFEPSAATTALQSFFIDDFCDVYVEYGKMFLGHEANKVSHQVFK